MYSEAATSSIQNSRAKRLKAEAVKKAAAVTAEAQARVMDPDAPGLDRTPQPLSKPNYAAKGLAKRAAAVEHRASTGTGEGGSVSSRQMPAGSTMESSSSSNEHVSGSTPDDSTLLMYEESSETRSIERSTLASDARSKGAGGLGGGDLAADAIPGRTTEAPVERWTAGQVNDWEQAEVCITLTEMPVVILFSRDDEVVAADDPTAEAIEAANKRYEAFCEQRRRDDGGNRYINHGTTTFNDPKKSVKCRAAPPSVRNSGGIQVAPWRIYDEYAQLQAEEGEDDRAVDAEARDDIEDEANPVEAADGGSDAENDAMDPTEEGGAGLPDSKKPRSYMTAESLLETVLIVERCVVQNNFEALQLAYRGIDMVPLKDHKGSVDITSPTTRGDKRKTAAEMYGAGFLDTQADAAALRSQEVPDSRSGAGRQASSSFDLGIEAAPKERMEVLWKFSGPLSKGKSVTCMAWNPTNTDLLAVGYGDAAPRGLAKQGGGVIACWSCKNPVAPERIITLPPGAGVSSMGFSTVHPSLLAVGCTDGTLALYDVRRHSDAPVMKTSVGTGQHTGTVWELKWNHRGTDRGESLISVSADGHVMEWNIRKGIERTADLMKLKRVPNRSQEGGNLAGNNRPGQLPKEALLARQSGGMTFDISPHDNIVYVVGTEDGTIHKCSRSQNENYLLDYAPHAEPVYRLRWSPFSSQHFLTCSADWTSRLYNVDAPDPLLRLDSNLQDAVLDISWSPAVSTVFAAATAQGRVQLWDIGDPLLPKASYQIPDVSLNCLLFAPQESPVIAVGDTNGDVTVVKLHGQEFERNGLSAAEQGERFNDVLQKVAL